MSRDEATVEAYKHLFPAVHNPKMPYVAFQQVVLRDRLATTTGEELEAIQECVDNRFEEDTARRERPWDGEGKAGEVISDLDKERHYVQRYVLLFIMSLAADIPLLVVRSGASQSRSRLLVIGSNT